MTLSHTLAFILLLTAINTTLAAPSHKGDWFFSWGYNRANYAKSDIHFRGDNYDFTLSDVRADDAPSQFKWRYVFEDITIPQTNTYIGYYLNNYTRLSFGVDHMKYVVRQNQSVRKTGLDHIGSGGTDQQILSEDYLQYEHTDGLNYINFGIDRIKPLQTSGIFSLNAYYGGDIGVTLPKSNVVLGPNNRRHDDFNLAGYGAALETGLIGELGDNWQLQLALKTGYLHMPDIRTTHDKSDKASQDIKFIERSLALVYVF